MSRLGLERGTRRSTFNNEMENAPTSATLSRRERLSLLNRADFKKRVAGWTFGWGVASALAAVVAAFWMVPAEQSPWPSEKTLKQAWNSVPSAVVAGGREQFPSKAVVIKDIRVSLPAATVNDGYGHAAYLDLRSHHRSQPVIDVKSVSPTRLDLVGRNGANAIMEMVVKRGGQPQFTTLYKGKALPHIAAWLHFVLGVLLPSLLSLCLLGLALDERPHYRKRLQEQLKRLSAERALRSRWQELVPNERFGPSEPELGFTLFRPLKADVPAVLAADTAGVCRLSVEEVRWDGERFRRSGAAQRVPQGLEAREIPLDDSVVQASEQWVELCQAVATANARRYAKARAVSEAEEKAKADALQRILDQLPDPDHEPQVAALLPPAAELLKTLPLD